jgi:hypothetical protein
MHKKRAIVRASGGEPLERIMIERGRRVIYLANPQRINAVLFGRRLQLASRLRMCLCLMLELSRRFAHNGGSHKRRKARIGSAQTVP